MNGPNRKPAADKVLPPEAESGRQLYKRLTFDGLARWAFGAKKPDGTIDFDEPPKHVTLTPEELKIVLAHRAARLKGGA